MTALTRPSSTTPESGDFLGLVIDAIDQSVIATDLEGNITYWNRFSERLYGWPAEEVVGRNILKVAPSSTTRAQAAEILQKLESGHHWSGELEVQRADGTTFLANMSYSPIFVLSGAMIGVVGISYDATEERRARDLLEVSKEDLELEVVDKTIELEEANQRLRKAYDNLSQLLRQIYQIDEIEKRRIGRELHDEIGQQLTALRMATERACQRRESPDLEDCLVQIDEIMRRVHSISLDLEVPSLEDLGLLHALLMHIDRWRARTHTEIFLHHAGLEARFDREIETAAFRVVQEALTNVARHAAAQNVKVSAWRLPGVLTIQVEDDGRGFDPEGAMSATESIGLRGVRERVTALSGTVRIDSSPGKGTCLTARFDLEEAS